MSLQLRNYTSDDLEACLELFDSNVPKFFAPEEREEFTLFLKLPSCVYWVLEDSGKIAGCGGYYITQETKEAGLCWGMIRNELHGTGLGKRLLLERLNRIVEHPEATFIRLDTSQHTFRFFEKIGFVTQKITPDGYWPGLDRYDMILTLDDMARSRIQSAYQGVLA